MIFQYTQVPNILLDTYLPHLTESELKILLVIFRQTNGWIDKFTGKRKTKDRITQSQFKTKTGLSKRIISKTLKMLSDKSLIQIYDRKHSLLLDSLERRGKSILLYSINPVHFATPTSELSDTKLMHKSAYNKRNNSKEIITKETNLHFKNSSAISVGEVINNSSYLWKFRLDK